MSPLLQVFTAVLMHYTRDQLPFTMFADSKVPNDIWGKNNGEQRGVVVALVGSDLGEERVQMCRGSASPLTLMLCLLLLLLAALVQARATCTCGATTWWRAVWTSRASASTACCTSST